MPLAHQASEYEGNYVFECHEPHGGARFRKKASLALLFRDTRGHYAFAESSSKTSTPDFRTISPSTKALPIGELLCSVEAGTVVFDVVQTSHFHAGQRVMASLGGIWNLATMTSSSSQLLGEITYHLNFDDTKLKPVRHTNTWSKTSSNDQPLVKGSMRHPPNVPNIEKVVIPSGSILLYTVKPSEFAPTFELAGMSLAENSVLLNSSYTRDDKVRESKHMHCYHPGAKWTQFTTEASGKDYWSDGKSSVWNEPPARTEYECLCSNFKDNGLWWSRTKDGSVKMFGDANSSLSSNSDRGTLRPTDMLWKASGGGLVGHQTTRNLSTYRKAVYSYDGPLYGVTVGQTVTLDGDACYTCECDGSVEIEDEFIDYDDEFIAVTSFAFPGDNRPLWLPKASEYLPEGLEWSQKQITTSDIRPWSPKDRMAPALVARACGEYAARLRNRRLSGATTLQRWWLKDRAVSRGRARIARAASVLGACITHVRDGRAAVPCA